MVTRNRSPLTEACRKIVVTGCTRYQLGETVLRKLRAGIVDRAFDDFFVAALDQNICDRAAENSSL